MCRTVGQYQLTLVIVGQMFLADGVELSTSALETPHAVCPARSQTGDTQIVCASRDFDIN